MQIDFSHVLSNPVNFRLNNKYKARLRPAFCLYICIVVEKLDLHQKEFQKSLGFLNVVIFIFSNLFSNIRKVNLGGSFAYNLFLFQLLELMFYIFFLTHLKPPPCIAFRIRLLILHITLSLGWKLVSAQVLTRIVFVYRPQLQPHPNSEKRISW